MEADENSLAPLDQIRALEMAARRRVATARKDSDTAFQDERQRAAALIEKARSTGQQEGLAQYERMLADARREVEALKVQAQKQAEDILKLNTDHQDGKGESWLDRSLQAILDAVLERERWVNHR
jgi:vacuolar-type H+-ATPase subunit H